jgi:hypothetical protein
MDGTEPLERSGGGTPYPDVEATMRNRWSVITLTLVIPLGACESPPLEPEATNPPIIEPTAALRLDVPAESPGPPYYAISANGGFIPQDGEWAAIPFLRELACIPADQDLLAFPVFAAFACPLTVQGHERWQNAPGVDLAPRQTQFMGTGAVPIVFVRWSEVQAALAGGLGFAELLALPSAIVGTADFYKETDILGISGPQGAGRGSYKINARGTLEDARPFSLHVNEVLGELRVVRITFGYPGGGA